MKSKKQLIKKKITLLARNTRRSITTKQTKPRPVASAAPHPGVGGANKKLVKQTGGEGINDGVVGGKWDL